MIVVGLAIARFSVEMMKSNDSQKIKRGRIITIISLLPILGWIIGMHHYSVKVENQPTPKSHYEAVVTDKTILHNNGYSIIDHIDGNTYVIEKQ